MSSQPLKERESEILKACLAYLWRKHIFHYRNNTGAITRVDGDRKRFIQFGVPGSPDIIAVINGQFVGIECKSQKGKQSPDQIAFQNRLEIAGGKYILVRSLDDLMAVV